VDSVVLTKSVKVATVARTRYRPIQLRRPLPLPDSDILRKHGDIRNQYQSLVSVFSKMVSPRVSITDWLIGRVSLNICGWMLTIWTSM
jgi:hypothetical protein